MSTSLPCRLLLHPPAPGPWNMAVDEVLLEQAAGQQSGCWRFYGWDVPTVSLGYFQDYADRWNHGPSRSCPAVRRLTGGGSIVHDAELTYSVVLPAGHRLASQRDLLYEAVHGCLIETLTDLGISAELSHGQGAGEEPLLCFQRRTPGDVVVGAVKIAGSAQRRRHGAVLQHGSLLLRRSPAAPELPGLEDLAGRPIAAQTIVRLWLGHLEQWVDILLSEGSLTERESQQAAALAKTRYAAAAWTENRDRSQSHIKNPFDLADCSGYIGP